MAGKRAAKRDGEQAAGEAVVLPPDCRMATLAALHTELVAALPGGAVELDGSQVERVDTAALQLLVLLRRALDGRGGALAWRGSSAALNDAAGLLGLAKILELPAARPA
ncbi:MULTISPECIES: STAS domain-containing protein [unclassified Rhodanobacter]|uniref:Lipid asymmetry maintenance protein MlaB n=1 Tax=Rhodanobacter humi TaxID=1888173 RepID=A0ABV4ARS3_9GAMM